MTVDDRLSSLSALGERLHLLPARPMFAHRKVSVEEQKAAGCSMLSEPHIDASVLSACGDQSDSTAVAHLQFAVLCWNAISEEARRLGIDPMRFAQTLANGGLRALIVRMEQFGACRLTEDNCASLDVATRRIRGIANRALNACGLSPLRLTGVGSDLAPSTVELR